VENPEERTPLGRPSHEWKHNIKMGLRGIGCGDMDWIDVAQDRDQWKTLVNTGMNVHVP
jgi:hypothetical protein